MLAEYSHITIQSNASVYQTKFLKMCNLDLYLQNLCSCYRYMYISGSSFVSMGNESYIFQ